VWVGKAVIFRWAVVAVIVFAAMIWGYHIIKNNQASMDSLPVYGNRNADSTEHVVGNFSLINQDGRLITQEDYKDKIYVADFFFTTCQGICPVMSDQMERVAEHFRDNPNVMFLSHTVKPEEDSVAALKEYARQHHADSLRWNFVTGNVHDINRLAFFSYLVADTTSEFVHTQFFALIDPVKRIRGYYDGTDSSEVNKLMSDINILLQESR
jgi:protein SCO1